MVKSAKTQFDALEFLHKQQGTNSWKLKQFLSTYWGWKVENLRNFVAKRTEKYRVVSDALVLVWQQELGFMIIVFLFFFLLVFFLVSATIHTFCECITVKLVFMPLLFFLYIDFVDVFSVVGPAIISSCPVFSAIILLTCNFIKVFIDLIKRIVAFLLLW